MVLCIENGLREVFYTKNSVKGGLVLVLMSHWRWPYDANFILIATALFARIYFYIISKFQNTFVLVLL